jgi:hypothetical protein
MQEDVAQYIRGCILCCTNNPSKHKARFIPSLTFTHLTLGKNFHGFYGKFSMPTTRKGHDYLFVVVDKFSKMCILMPCKKTIKGQEAANMFFEQVWVHFGIPRSIISNRDTRFLSTFWTTLQGEDGH